MRFSLKFLLVMVLLACTALCWIHMVLESHERAYIEQSYLMPIAISKTWIICQPAVRDVDRLYIWNRITSRMTHSISGLDNLSYIAFGPTGDIFVTLSLEKLPRPSRAILRVWESNTGKLVASRTGATNEFSCVSMISNGQQLVVGGSNGKMQVLDINTLNSQQIIDIHDEVYCVAMSPKSDTYTIVTKSNTGIGSLVLVRGSHRQILESYSRELPRLSFDAAGLHLLTLSEGKLRVFDIQTGLVKASFDTRSYPMDTPNLRVGKNGRIAFTFGGGLFVGRLDKLDDVRVVAMPSSRVTAIEFLDNGDIAAAGCGSDYPWSCLLSEFELLPSDIAELRL